MRASRPPWGSGRTRMAALAIALSVSLPGLPDADARNLMEQAHKVCPYSNATRNNIDVKLGLG
jgi:osmotically inducible protein OsmC